MPINKIEFVNLEDQISETGKSHLDCLAPDIGKVYVIAITEMDAQRVRNRSQGSQSWRSL